MKLFCFALQRTTIQIQLILLNRVLLLDRVFRLSKDQNAVRTKLRFGLIGKEKTGNIDVLAVGDTVTVKSGLVFGFGKATITVEAAGAQLQKDGTVLLFFVVGL